MKITLDQFKCWDKQTFVLPDQGLVLFHGKSGAGKSSVLQGLYFALYGKGNKLPRFGSTGKCSVEIEYGQLVIKRTKKPNRLTVTYLDPEETPTVLEDAAAQAYIQSVFGSYFEMTSYIQQKGLNSFLHASPAEKLEFLEKMMDTEMDVPKLKKTIKTRIIDQTSQLNECKGQLAVYEKLKEEAKSNLNEFETSDAYKDNIYKKLSKPSTEKNKDILTRNRLVCEKRLSDLQTQYSVMEEEIRQQQLNVVHIKNYVDQLGEISSKIEETQKELTTIQTIDITNLQTECQLWNERKEQVYRKKQYQEVLEEQKAKIQDQLSMVSYFELWMNMSKEECEHNMELLKKKLSLEKGLESYRKEMVCPEVNMDELLLEQTTLQNQLVLCDVRTCPHCEGKVILGLGGLLKYQPPANKTTVNEEKTKKQIQEELEDVKEEIEENKKLLHQFKTIQEKMEVIQKALADILLPSDMDLEGYYKENCLFESLLQKRQDLEEEKFDEFQTLASLKKQITDSDYTMVQINNMLSTIQDKLAQERVKQMQKLTLEKTMLKLEKEQTLLQGKLDSIETKDVSELRKEQGILQEKIKVESKRHVEYQTKLVHIQHHLRCLELKIKYIQQRQSIKDLLIKKHTHTQFIVQLQTLQTKLVQAESIVLEHTVACVNTAINEYLESFFASPIEVELSCFKDTLKGVTKPCIHLQIRYGTEESFDLASLSGGEYDRVQLALTLAFSKVFSSPLLMLDESISSLDESTTEKVLRSVRNMAEDKLILIVAHQTVHGVFDEIVPFES